MQSGGESMSISDDFIQELKYKNDISDVIAGYVHLKRKGKNLLGLCPFHTEKTPSFYIYPSSSSFYCFGCGAGGDVITFIRLIEKLDYVEALKFLCDRAGMQLPIGQGDDKVHKKKILTYEINREAARFFHKNLCDEKNKNVLEYLLKRGLKVKTIKHFGLGYAVNSRFSLINYLKNKGYKENDIVDANLGFRTRNGSVCDRFFDRVMFPIIDLRGNVIAFGGRIIGDGKPKYLNTSDTIVFKKSTNLFALNFAKTETNGQIILAEGYMDVIALHQAGFQNTVATLGTALTEEQAKIISRYANEVIISYDADEAGQKAASRAINIFRNIGVNVRVITIPKGKDPDEFMKTYGDEGPTRFRKIIEDSKNDIEYRLQKIKSDYNLNRPDEKVKYLTKAAKILAELDNSIEQEIYASKLSAEIGIEKSSMMIQIEKYKKYKNRKDETQYFKDVVNKTLAFDDKVNPDKKDNLRASVAEEALISYMMNNQDRAPNILEKVSEDMFITVFNRKIYNIIKKLYEENREFDITNISSQGLSVDEIGKVTKIFCGYVPSSGTNEALEEYISVMKQEKYKQKVNDVKDMDALDIKEYIERLKAIKK